MILSVDQRPNVTPKPFLGPLFESDVQPTIEAGYLYSADETAMHGISQHGAIDFALARGTTILAPADGWAICTYGEMQLTNDGQPRLISLAQAQQHSSIDKLRLPSGDGPWPAWYGSFVLQIWHGSGRYTQYAHIDWVDERIPYFAPTVQDNADLKHHPILRAPLNEYRRQAIKVKKGQVIAVSGMTGCGWGQRCYETADFNKHGRPDFRGSDYTYWDQSHLHFVVMGQRAGKARKPRYIWDPFGIYGDNQEKYPTLKKDWPRLSQTLWL